ncbi:hypothetical protein IW967_05875 [Alicyclobacillus mali]|uniref:Uncharacterized protein n=1 Tax=Alicyclobacillus mali (ex Roth et al. 2021) TaxID=1123961 RepID=A0ABS0F2C3_9BACL|nr:hypothetical protein [Alicyclobacillus mali (ex Roth et al. 2021)]MBF8377401.1 hypothetical protein [Alicyclobacillus mali (ex Roth et al. 2021)]MCL6488279.1 hypothetical protein [Alicyclobacillus mali (ex Roth et al. 2021)]
MGQVQMRPRGRRVGRRFLAIAALCTACESLFFYHLNHVLVSQQTASQREIQAAMHRRAQTEILQLKREYAGVTISPNGEYATYVTSDASGWDTVHVVQLDSGTQVSQATNLYPVQYVDWLGNAEVFVGEQRSPGNLELNTFYVSNGLQADETAASVPVFSNLAPDARIVKVTYSTETNDIFVLIDAGGSTAVYHVGTMETIQPVTVPPGYIKNIAMTQTGDNLYLEINQNGQWNVVRLYQTSQTSSYTAEFQMDWQTVKSNAALIGVVGNTLYYGTVNANGLVTAVYRQTSGGDELLRQLGQPALASEIAVSSTGSIALNPPALTNVEM